MFGVFYVVNVSRPVGGTIDSADGKIHCGTAGGTANDCGPASWLWSDKASFTVTPDADNYFQSWAGDCADVGECKFDMVADPGADKWVVAVFNPIEQLGHARWTSPAKHGPAFFRYLAGAEDSPRCQRCHGADFQGVANAPSCNACHAAAGWTSWQTNCSFCHGDRTQKAGYVAGTNPLPAAPPDDVAGRLSGTNGSATGAHAIHLQGSSLASPIACGQCHVVPVAPAVHGAGDIRLTALHVNGNAAVSFGNLATGGGATSPSWNPTTHSCSATWCHGGALPGSTAPTRTPAWTQAGDPTLRTCQACHGAPPASHGPGASECGSCHDGYTGSTVSLAVHVNGSIDVRGGNGWSCGGCHGIPPTTSGHPAAPVPMAVEWCGHCHEGYTSSSVNTSTHGNGTVDVTVTADSCRECHGAPPPVSVNDHPQINACGKCHTGYTGTSVNLATHRNGSVDVIPMSCTTCHGTAAGDLGPLGNSAPPYGVNGESAITERAVGAHRAHLTGTTSGNVAMIGPIACATCHTVPTQVPVDLTHQSGGAAQVAAALSYNVTNATCSTACHGVGTLVSGGINKMPTWTSTISGCTSCHAFPPTSVAHAGVAAATTACHQCHGTSVEADGGFVFAADGSSLHVNGVVDESVSQGNQGCATCHVTAMTSAATYHHVVTDAGVDALSKLTVYPVTTSWPLLAGQKTCVMCHADHNLFSPLVNLGGVDKGYSLRTSIGAAPPTVQSGATIQAPPATSNIASSDTSLCLSCHSASQAKDRIGQKDDGTASTPAVTPTAFPAPSSTGGSHSYQVAGSFGGSGNDFQVNCTKCHASGSTQYQDGSFRFVLHESADRRLLYPMGMTPADNLEEKFCYRCHSKVGDTNPGGAAAKAAAGYDYFGTGVMVSSSEDIFARVTGNGTAPASSHLPGSYAGAHKPGESLAGIAASKHVECVDCHDPHQAKRGGQSEEGAYSGTTGSAVTTLTDVSQKWLPNAFVGYVIDIYIPGSTASSNQGARGQITGNTATTLTFGLSTGSVIPPSGSTRYRISMKNNSDGISSAAASTLTSSTNYLWMPNAFAGWTVHIVKGTGAGQSATVTGNTNNQLTISGTWSTNPDTTSKYSLSKLSNTMAGSEGVKIAWGTGTPTSWGATNTFTPGPGTPDALPAATSQLQVCAKCHSAANSALATWSSSTWTNVAQDFNPSNGSFHPVAARMDVSGGTLLGQAQLTNGWRPGDTMACSDCHGNSDTSATAAQGPHASAVKFILRGPNTRWPFQTNGTTRWTPGNRATSQGTADGLFCLNCHNMANNTAPHTDRSNHSNLACTACHIRIPHGGKVKRLIRTTNAAAPYADTGVAASLRAYNGGTGSNACSASCTSSHSAATTTTNAW
jgi:predicted CxxxxCH...CXXCH cytochrome family protein